MKKIFFYALLFLQPLNSMPRRSLSKPSITIQVTLFQEQPSAPFEAHTFCPQCKKAYDATDESDTNALLYVQAYLALHMLNKHNIYTL